VSLVLNGQVILNTRPVHQQADLSALLESDGAQVLSFAAIDIQALPSSASLQGLAQKISQFDIVIFVSRNAVDAAFNWIDNAVPEKVRLAVIGEASRIALAQKVPHLDRRLISSEPYNSEALLDAEELQSVAGMKVLILRGQEGRNLLGGTLQARGAEVSYCEVYRRALPNLQSNVFSLLVEPVFPTLVILTSNEGMQNLMQLVDSGSSQRLCRTPWLLISERMRESALDLGHNAPIVIARSASDNGIHQTICEWASQKN
jgi:uroporphyrinogen-III synthase